MRRTLIMIALVLAMVVGACAADVTESDEYQDLENELAALEQELPDPTAALAATRAEVGAAGLGGTDVPPDVAAVIDAWWAANERGDGSVADLYLPSGYHLYGDQRILGDAVAAHLSNESWTSERIAGPYLVVAEPQGRYVVTLGVRNTLGEGLSSAASALTFEIVTRAGELMIAETNWTAVTN